MYLENNQHSVFLENLQILGIRMISALMDRALSLDIGYEGDFPGRPVVKIQWSVSGET